MTWTSQRIDLLKTLWAEGQSASAIACRIGGKTRNAVIGKVHRLGLAGRARTHTPRRRTQTLRARSRKDHPAIKARAKPQRSLTALPELTPAPPFAVTAVTLTGVTCRWPIGDPFDAGFHFCGRAAGEHVPYCPHHMAIAHR